jgi:hypothetical protein
MAKGDGKAAIAGEILAAAGAAAAPAVEQLDMLMPPTRTNLSKGEQARVETAIRRDRRGRPPGAENIAKREMLDFVRKVFGDPVLRRFQYAEHTPESLAIVLGCSKLEAYDRLMALWGDLQKLFYANLAQVDSSGNAVAPRLTMVFPGQSAPQIGADGVPRPPWMYIEETQQNQALLASPSGVSHGDVSHSEDNTSDISDMEPSGR